MKHKIELLMRDTADALRMENVDGWTFSLKEGEFVLAICKDEQEKRRILYAAGALSSGENVWLCGKTLHELSQKERAALRKQCVAFVTPDALCVEDRTVLWNITEFCPSEKEVDEGLLRDAGLAGLEKKKAGKLSFAQCQRLAVLRALIKEPALVLADAEAVEDEKAAELLCLCNRRGAAVLLTDTGEVWSEKADKTVTHEEE